MDGPVARGLLDGYKYPEWDWYDLEDRDPDQVGYQYRRQNELDDEDRDDLYKETLYREKETSEYDEV